jgi:hypothetical protein
MLCGACCVARVVLCVLCGSCCVVRVVLCVLCVVCCVLCCMLYPVCCVLRVACVLYVVLVADYAVVVCARTRRCWMERGDFQSCFHVHK